MAHGSRFSRMWMWVVALLFLTGCNQATTTTQDRQSPDATETSAAPAGAGADIDACDLLSQAEVAAATGYQLGQPSSSRVQSQCPWPSTDPDAPGKRVLLEASLTDQAADNLISGYRKQMTDGGRSVTSVSGIGDDALLVTGEDAGPFAEVYAVKASGGQTAVLRLNIGGEAESFDANAMTEAAKSLMKTAISRLP